VAIHTKQAPYMTYVIAVRVPKGTVADALLWDTLDPYHYVRLDKAGGEILIVGGEDHKSGQAHDAERRFADLELWTRTRFPAAREVAYRWSGQVMETQDYLAFAGRNPGDEHVFIATGDSGMGMTHGTIAGIVITDLIHGAETPWSALYDPSRVKMKAAPTFARENANVAWQYASWIRSGEAESEVEVAPGEGAVVRRGAHKVAIYRDAEGGLHEMSAICPHLGCPVSWNSAAKTWDCKCHGSRFAALGEVINGPANRGLAARA
jgi:Rieske Fe-S protein